MGNVLYRKVGGEFKDPHDLVEDDAISRDTRLLLRDVFKGIDADNILDSHCHLLGIGKGEKPTGCYVHDKMQSYNLYHSIKLKVMMAASGVAHGEPNPDRTYKERLAALTRNCCPFGKEQSSTNIRCLLLAFDQVYNLDGTLNKHLTGMHTPNEYAWEVAQEYPDQFYMAASVHPYRKDALSELEKWAAKGVNVIKWLPNSQGIDPSNEICRTYYEKMKELGLVLLTHTGLEHSVDAGFVDQSYGNPLKLRLPLEIGVRVIAAHCASEGCDDDTDDKEGGYDDEIASCDSLDLFLRLMDEPKYKGLLFGDISAITTFRRAHTIHKLLLREDLHDRLLYGSDYPVPCVNVVVRTSTLQKYSLITKKEKTSLDEIYRFNPLLFTFAVARTLSYEGHKFKDSVFQTHEILKGIDKQHPNRKLRRNSQSDSLDLGDTEEEKDDIEKFSHFDEVVDVIMEKEKIGIDKEIGSQDGSSADV